MRRVSLAGLAVLGALLLAIPSAFAQVGRHRRPRPSRASRARQRSRSAARIPLSGPVASYGAIAAGMKAYFSYVNARRGPDGKRGIYGRQIVWKYYDDGYNPVNSVQLTAQARGGGQGLRGCRLGRHRGQRGGTPVPELDRPCRTSSCRPARPSSARSSSSTRGRSGGSRTTSPRRRLYGARHQAEPHEREDRDPLPERQLRQGLS